MQLENEDFSLEIRKWTDETKKLGRLAYEIICKAFEEVNTKKKRHLQMPERSKEGKFKRMFPSKDLVEKYSRLPIYGQIIDYLLENIGEKTDRKEIAQKLREYYKEKLKRKITDGTARVYAYNYAKKMIERGDLEETDILGKFKVIKKQTRNLADEIYGAAKRKGWIGKNIPISIISKEVNADEDEVKLALVKLFSLRIAIQQPGDKIRF